MGVKGGDIRKEKGTGEGRRRHGGKRVGVEGKRHQGGRTVRRHARGIGGMKIKEEERKHRRLHKGSRYRGRNEKLLCEGRHTKNGMEFKAWGPKA